MTCRQTVPTQWLILDARMGDNWRKTIRRLPRGNGVLVLCKLSVKELRSLRHLARLRQLSIVEERSRKAARVHNVQELREALQKRTPLLFISPIFKTESHSDWLPLPRMRAAALARLAKRKVIALGGMNCDRFNRVQRLGFIGWAGISAFKT